MSTDLAVKQALDIVRRQVVTNGLSSHSVFFPARSYAALTDFASSHRDITNAHSHQLHQGLLSVYHQLHQPPLSPLRPTHHDRLTDHPVEASSDKAEADDDDGVGQSFCTVDDAFIAVLNVLSPTLKAPDDVIFWWSHVMIPVIDSHDFRPLTGAEDARQFAYNVLLGDQDGPPTPLSAVFLRHLVDTYVSRSMLWTAQMPVQAAEHRHIVRELEAIFSHFSGKRPKEFLVLIDRLLTKSRSRTQALRLLGSFIEHYPQRAGAVVGTDILTHLLSSLLTDLSGLVVSMALSALIAIVPQISQELIPLLPQLFLVYNRIVCWDLYLEDARTDEPDGESDGLHKDCQASDHESDLESADRWESIGLGLDDNQTVAPKADLYFTVLYGLFPITFTSFIRKPRRFLKEANFPAAREVELKQSPMAARSAHFQARHVLHPNFLNLTAEEELEGFRFRKSCSNSMVKCLKFRIEYHVGKDDGGRSSRWPALQSDRTSSEVGATDRLDRLDDRLEFVRFEERGEEILRSENQTLSDSATLDQADDGAESLPDQTAVLTPQQDLSANVSVADEGVPLNFAADPDRPTDRHAGPGEGVEPAKTAAQSYANATVYDGTKPTVDRLQRIILLLDTELKFERYLRLEHLVSLQQAQAAVHELQVNYEEAHTLVQSNKFLRQRLSLQTEEFNRYQNDVIHRADARKAWAEQVEKQARQALDRERQAMARLATLELELEAARAEGRRFERLYEEVNSTHILDADMRVELESKVAELPVLRSKLREAQRQARDQADLEAKLTKALDDCDHLKAAADLLARPGNDASAGTAVVVERADKVGGSDRVESGPTGYAIDRQTARLDALIDTVLAAKDAELAAERQHREAIRASCDRADRRCLELEGLIADAREEADRQRRRADEAVDQARVGGPTDEPVSELPIFFGPVGWPDTTVGGRPMSAASVPEPDRPMTGSSAGRRSVGSGRTKPAMGHQPSFMERILGMGLHPNPTMPGSGTVSSHSSTIGLGHGPVESELTSGSIARSMSSRGRLVSKSSGLSNRSAGASAATVTATGTMISTSTASGPSLAAHAGRPADYPQPTGHQYQQPVHQSSSTTKVTAKSDVRVFGRGGAQNVGSKIRDRREEEGDEGAGSAPASGPGGQHHRTSSKGKLVAAHLLGLGHLRK